MSGDLDRILGELQQEVEGLRADLERDSIQSSASSKTSSDTQSLFNSQNNRVQNGGPNSSCTEPEPLSLEDIQAEIAKIIKKQQQSVDKHVFATQPSSTKTTSALPLSRNKLQRSVSPSVTNLQTSFSTKPKNIVAVDSSTSSSPVSVTTLSPISPQNTDSLRSLDLELSTGHSIHSIGSTHSSNISSTSAQNGITTVGVLRHKSSSSGSLSASLQSSPKLEPQPNVQQKDNSESEPETSDDIDSETESDTDSDSSYNPLSMTSRSAHPRQGPFADFSSLLSDDDNSPLNKSLSNDYRVTPSAHSSNVSTPTSSNADSPILPSPLTNRIRRKPTTGHGLGKVRLKSEPLPVKDISTPPTPFVQRELLGEKERDPRGRLKSPMLDRDIEDRSRFRSRSHERTPDEGWFVYQERNLEGVGQNRSRTREDYTPERRNPERIRDHEGEIENERESERTRERSKSRPQEVVDDLDLRKYSGKRSPRIRETGEDKGKERYDEWGRTREREAQNDKERAKSRTREPENSKGRARSRPRGEKETDFDREREWALESSNGGRSREGENVAVGDRGRTKTRQNGNNEQGRSKSRPRGDDNKGRAKSRTRDPDDRVRGKSRTREGDFDFEKERDLHLERSKSRGRNGEDKAKQLERSKSKRDKQKASGKGEKEDEVKITTRIYINDNRQFKTLALTPKMNALSIIEYFRKKNTVEEGEWTLFELVNDFGLERPLRDWELVTSIIESWDKMSNTLLLKKYSYRNSLTVEGLKNGVPPLFGWLYLKKNKWQKRYFVLKDGGLYHSKDQKGTDSTLLCSVSNYDVYTPNQTVKKAPKPFVFALKSQDRMVMFENPEDYVHYLCADHMDKMKDWVLSIRTARNQMMLETHPGLFTAVGASVELMSPTSPKLPATKDGEDEKAIENMPAFSSSEQWANLRRHVREPGKKLSTKQLFDFSQNSTYPTSDEENKGTIQIFKSGSLLDNVEKSPPIKQTESEEVAFIEGSLLASSEAFYEAPKEKVTNTGGTLVYIDDDVRFHKGSLLEARGKEHAENNNSASSNTLVQIDDEVRFHKGSLLATRGALSPGGVFSPGKESFEISTPQTPEFNKGSLLASRGLLSPSKELHEISSPQTPKFNKGSLLSPSKESHEISSPQTPKFNKGSLLSPSKESHEISSPQTPKFNKGSLLSPSKDNFDSKSHKDRRPSNGPLLSIDPPSTPHKHNTGGTKITPGKKLLQIDLKPDAQHTLDLRNKDFKPLLSFLPGHTPSESDEN